MSKYETEMVKTMFFPVVHLVIQEETYVCHGQTPKYCKDALKGKSGFWLMECLVLFCPISVFILQNIWKLVL